MAAQPNILLIQSDQHRYDCIGANGSDTVKTPNMDRLASEGVNFSHAFCPIPMCVPTRCSLLTGQWPLQHGTIFNFDAETFKPLPDDIETFAHVLSPADYTLAHVGRWHVDPERTPVDFGFDTFIPDSDYYTWRKSAGLADIPRTSPWFGETDPHITPAQSRTAWGANRIIELLNDYTESRTPFFMRWDTIEPHLPNIVPEPFASLYPPAQIPRWPSFAETFEGKPWIQSQQLKTWKLDGWTWDDWAPIVSRYMGEITLLDSQIGRVLDALEGMGIADNTVVIYTSDHGDMCGGHRMIDKHYIMYDDVVRVPFIMRWPERITGGKTCDAFIASSVDLAATFCDIAGVDAPGTFKGQSVLPTLTGDGTNTREDIFSSFHGNQFGLYSQRMVRDRKWKYVWNATAEDELYNLEADPHELRNLWKDPSCSEELARLRRRLVEWMEELGDPLCNTWTRPQILEGLK